MKRTYTPQQRAAMVADFNAGIKPAVIAAKYGCHESYPRTLAGSHKYLSRRVMGLRPVDEARDEVRRRLEQIEASDTRDLTQRFCGDPIPGRSALDMRTRP